MKIINNIVKDSKSLVFLDFEATETTFEIISIGAVKAELDNKKQIKSFDNGFRVYIKTNTEIGPIIEKITGLNNQILNEKGISFVEAIDKLSKYVGDTTFVRFMTYGNYDMRLLHVNATNNKLLENNLVLQVFRKNIDFSVLLHKYVRRKNNQTISLINALKIFNVTAIEPIHDSLSDAKNLMLLYQAFLKNHNIIKEEYLKVLVHNSHLGVPIQKLLNKLIEEKTVTLDDLYFYINEELR